MDGLIFNKKIEDERVILGPSYGEDAAVIRFKDEFLVVHSDPISGAEKNIGWISLHVAANDIAVCGASPAWALPSLQFPDGYPEKKIEEVIENMYRASDELGVDMIGGHSETIEGIEAPLITTGMMGTTEDVVFTRGSKQGDKIIQVNEAGIEGTWILASDFEEELKNNGVERDVIERAKGLGDKISVVESALSIKEKVTSMHDPTEGGLLQGLYEMAYASKNRFVIDTEPKLRKETIVIADRLDIDPSRLISSGCLIATVPKTSEVEDGKVIGMVEEGEPAVEFLGDEIEEIQEDELFRIVRSFDRSG